VWDSYSCARRKKRVKRKYWIYNVFRAIEEEGEFHTLLGRLKDNRQQFSKYFRMSISKPINPKRLLYTDIEKKNSQWGRSITEERVALTLRSVYKIYHSVQSAVSIIVRTG
jgi:hypothetical protein